MMANDWQDKLKALKMTMPDLPEGEAADTGADAGEVTDISVCPRLDIMLERKGRAGKSATIIYGFGDAVSEDFVAELASGLRKRLGTGGSARGGEILIQGDRRTDVLRLLLADGYKARIV